MSKLGIFTIGMSLAGATLLPSTAIAQDMPVLDPSAYSRPMVMHGAINAQARRNGARAAAPRNGLSPQAASTCSQKSSMRARYGAGDPRVTKLYRLCAQAGM